MAERGIKTTIGQATFYKGFDAKPGDIIKTFSAGKLKVQIKRET